MSLGKNILLKKALNFQLLKFKVCERVKGFISQKVKPTVKNMRSELIRLHESDSSLGIRRREGILKM